MWLWEEGEEEEEEEEVVLRLKGVEGPPYS